MAGAEDHYVPAAPTARSDRDPDARAFAHRTFVHARGAGEENHCQIGNFEVAFRTIIDWMTGLGPIEKLTDV